MELFESEIETEKAKRRREETAQYAIACGWRYDCIADNWSIPDTDIQASWIINLDAG